MQQILRQPLLHFALFGATAFVVFDWLGDTPPAPWNDRIAVPEARVAQLVEGCTMIWPNGAV